MEIGEKTKELIHHQETRQFVRFCIVGGTCALIDAAIASFRPLSSGAHLRLSHLILCQLFPHRLLDFPHEILDA